MTPAVNTCIECGSHALVVGLTARFPERPCAYLVACANLTCGNDADPMPNEREAVLLWNSRNPKREADA